eukprot:scaffold2470_cov114-Cylindrotheca_fusiformis.AAC.7
MNGRFTSTICSSKSGRKVASASAKTVHQGSFNFSIAASKNEAIIEGSVSWRMKDAAHCVGILWQAPPMVATMECICSSSIFGCGKCVEQRTRICAVVKHTVTRSSGAKGRKCWKSTEMREMELGGANLILVEARRQSWLARKLPDWRRVLMKLLALLAVMLACRMCSSLVSMLNLLLLVMPRSKSGVTGTTCSHNLDQKHTNSKAFDSDDTNDGIQYLPGKCGVAPCGLLLISNIHMRDDHECLRNWTDNGLNHTG